MIFNDIFNNQPTASDVGLGTLNHPAMPVSSREAGSSQYRRDCRVNSYTRRSKAILILCSELSKGIVR
jgi:hypothetical protein